MFQMNKEVYGLRCASKYDYCCCNIELVCFLLLRVLGYFNILSMSTYIIRFVQKFLLHVCGTLHVCFYVRVTNALVKVKIEKWGRPEKIMKGVPVGADERQLHWMHWIALDWIGCIHAILPTMGHWLSSSSPCQEHQHQHQHQ